jgi:hypothetical protein
MGRRRHAQQSMTNEYRTPDQIALDNAANRGDVFRPKPEAPKESKADGFVTQFRDLYHNDPDAFAEFVEKARGEGLFPNWRHG